MLLLLMWVGPVGFVQTDSWRLLKWAGAPRPLAADSPLIPAGQAVSMTPGTQLELHLRDGTTLHGRFLGRTLLDSVGYAQRFAARVSSSSHTPFAWGETLRVALRDGRAWAAPFVGYGELSLLLRGPDGAAPVRVPFESAREIRRANRDRIPPKDLARAFRSGSLPSAEALAIARPGPGVIEADWWADAHLVAVEDIASVSAELPSRPGVNVVGVILLTVVVSVVVFVLLLRSVADGLSKGCRSIPNSLPPPNHALTTRPFDRDRGCFLGDPLAVADPWPGSVEDGPAVAAGSPQSSARTE